MLKQGLYIMEKKNRDRQAAVGLYGYYSIRKKKPCECWVEFFSAIKGGKSNQSVVKIEKKQSPRWADGWSADCVPWPLFSESNKSKSYISDLVVEAARQSSTHSFTHSSIEARVLVCGGGSIVVSSTALSIQEEDVSQNLQISLGVWVWVNNSWLFVFDYNDGNEDDDHSSQSFVFPPSKCMYQAYTTQPSRAF